MMNDPVAEACRAAAAILAPDFGPALPTDVEAALYANDTSQERPTRYADPVSLGNLIVAIATLAWMVYCDKRKRTPDPAPESIARQVRRKLHERGDPLPPGAERVTEVVVTEIVKAASVEK
jgi:hypothetical protein